MSDIDRPTLQRAPTLVARRCNCGDYAGFGLRRAIGRSGGAGRITRTRHPGDWKQRR